jgi:hypothetical protein
MITKISYSGRKGTTIFFGCQALGFFFQGNSNGQWARLGVMLFTMGNWQGWLWCWGQLARLDVMLWTMGNGQGWLWCSGQLARLRGGSVQLAIGNQQLERSDIPDERSESWSAGMAGFNRQWAFAFHLSL